MEKIKTIRNIDNYFYLKSSKYVDIPTKTEEFIKDLS